MELSSKDTGASGERRRRMPRFEKWPDIILLAGTAQEDPAVITAAADLALIADDISRGYTIPLGAQKMGAKTFVHVSFPRHMSYETLGRRRAIMEASLDRKSVV